MHKITFKGDKVDLGGISGGRQFATEVNRGGDRHHGELLRESFSERG